MTALARAKYSPERRVRPIRRSRSRAVSAATRSRSMRAVAGVVALIAPVYGRAGRSPVRLSPAQQRAADLPAGGLRQLVGEVDDARVLVGRRLGLDVVLELAGEAVRGRVPVTEH